MRGARESLPPPLLAWALAAAWLAACLILPSRYHNFDGTACAMAVELGDPRYLVHGNHLAYGVLGRAAYLMARWLGYEGRSWTILALMNALLAAASLGLFYRFLLRLGAGERRALAASAGLAVSYAFWYYSLEVQVYPLGFLFLLAAADSAMRDPPAPGRVGVLHALALTGHVVHLCAAPAFLHRIWTTSPPEGRVRSVLRYAAAGLAATLAAYALGAWAARPAGWTDFHLWLRGTAGPRFGEAFEWHGGVEPHRWLKGLVLTVWAQPGSLGLAARSGPWFRLQAALTLGVLGLALWRAPRGLRTFFGLWLAGYLAFVMTWEPTNPNFHVTDLIPLWSLLALWEPPRLGRRGATAALAAAAAALGLNNLVLGILPHSREGSNPFLRDMASLRELTPEDAWVATLDTPSMVYVPYFALRRPWTLPRRTREPAPGEPVFALPEVIDDPRWRGRLAESWEWSEAGNDGARLYRLERKPARVK